MKKTFLILKAVLTRDMNLYGNQTFSKKKDNSHKTVPLIMSILILISMAIFASILGLYLKRMNKTYIMLSMFSVVFVISLFMEGICKSQDILFVAKDNDLLLSLPIKDKTLLLIRVIKLLIYEFIYNLLFISPVFFIYVLFEKPGMSFYIASLIFAIVMPIIPTILASIDGYLIKWLTSKFKAKKLTQLILSFISTFICFILISNFKLGSIIKNAESIHNAITKYYYPIDAYIKLMNNFDILTLIKLLLFNFIPLIIFIYLGSIFYFKIISKSNETGIVKNDTKIKKIKKYSKKVSLIRKELLNYITTPMYSYNTLLGLATMLIATIYMCFNKSNIINSNISVLTPEYVLYYLPKLYFIAIVFISSTLTISASSLSLEGRSFNLIKVLPIDVKEFINTKLLSSILISSTVFLLSSIIFILSFQIFNKDALILLLSSIVFPSFISILGLLLNFRYPKLEYTNVSEVVKQSLSILVSELLGIFIFVLCIVIIFFNILDIYKGMYIELILFTILSIIFYIILIKYGSKKYKDINL